MTIGVSKLPILKSSEIKVDKKLGHGGFCTVLAVRKIMLSKDEHPVQNTTSNSSSSSSSSSCSNTTPTLISQEKTRSKFRKQFHDYENKYFSKIVVPGYNNSKQNNLDPMDQKPPRVALKRLKDCLKKDDDRYKTGIEDLMSEIEMLSRLNHPNIISIYAIGQEDDEYDDNKVFQPTFCVIDQLRGTLRTRLHKWNDDIGIKIFKSHQTFNEVWLERLVVLLRIADALSYMHSKGVVHRDINPDNIGFTYDNDVKIFDFGLAKALFDDKGEVNKAQVDELYDLTGVTGTLRYMSPEVGLGMPYGLKVDVYSFALVMHEVLSLQKPFIHVKAPVFQDQVMKGGLRPPLDESWPLGITMLISDMWSSDIGRRPTSKQVLDRLGSILRGTDVDLFPVKNDWRARIGNTLNSVADELKTLGEKYMDGERG
jgi:serine/threonine protein kinase